MPRIPLTGDGWYFKGFVGEDWRWTLAPDKARRQDFEGWMPGRVPGSVLDDLLRNGCVPDPYFDLNSLLVEWVPQRTWVYKRLVRVPAEHSGQRVRLHFEGVDYAATFLLNGDEIGEHRSMFVPATFELGDRLAFGEDNVAAVVLHPAPLEQSQIGYTSRVRTHKSRMPYGWDFCPRMVHLGIWDDAWLDVTGPTAIDDVWVRPVLSGDLSAARVDVTVTTSGPAPARVETTLYHARDEPALVNAMSDQAGPTQQRFVLEQPELWWPNGAGEQALYSAQTRVFDAGGNVADARTTTFGIRRLELVPNAGAPPHARPYTMSINNRRVFMSGWNWVPIDVLYGPERPGKLAHLLGLARRAHVNLLRVWGGGLIERRAFYDACDRLGLLVWQEFIQSSSGLDNAPSETPAFVELMVREAEGIVPRRRNHPSLAIWCGGNELQTTDNRPLDDGNAVLGALQATVARLDPDRVWLPTSPTGRVFANTLDNIRSDPDGMHDVHGPWEHQGLIDQYTLSNSGVALLHSEFGVEGLTNQRTLDATVPTEYHWPATRANPHFMHRGAWWINEPRLQAMWSGRLTNLDALRRASQFAQAEGLRYAVEANRRRQWRCSGSIPWQFNEPFPNAYCTSAVDYFGRPKPAYYAVARAYAPFSLSASLPTAAWVGRMRFEADVWGCNSLRHPVHAELTARMVGASGSVYWQHAENVVVAPDTATRLCAVVCPLAEIGEDLFFLDLASEFSPESRYLFSRTDALGPMFDLPVTAVHALVRIDNDTWTVSLQNYGQHAALMVTLEDDRDVHAVGYAQFSDNCFSLLPGEQRSLDVQWLDVPAAERQLAIQGWNTARLTLPEAG